MILPLSFRIHKSFQILIVLSLVASLNSSCTKKDTDKENAIQLASRALIKGLDPHSASDVYSGTAIAQIYEGLLHYNYLKRPYTVEPELAEAMPSISEDGLTYTFKIKKGVHFQNDPAFAESKGRELKAQDFVYSFKRLADPATRAEGFWVLDGKVKGLNEWAENLKNKKANYETAVEGLQTPDDNTLVIKLVQPYNQLLYVLTMAPTYVIAHEVVEKYGKEFLNHPIGTGPFEFDSWVRGSKLVLKKNPTYREDLYPSEADEADKAQGLLVDAGKKMPLADKFVMYEMPEDSTRWQNFMKGNVDAIEIPVDNFATAIADGKMKPEFTAKGMSSTVVAGDDYVYVSMNMKDPILGKSKELRQAMTLANDNLGLIKKFYNAAAPAHGPIPPNIAGNDPKYVSPYQKLDLEKAKELLKKAGYPEGKGLPELVFESLSDTKNRQISEFFQQNMAQIGIKVRINTNTWPQFQDKIKNSKAQIFGIAWTADYPDGQNFLQLFYSKNASPGPNDSNFNNPEYDKLYEKALLLKPGTERDELYHKMRDILIEQSPQIFQVNRQFYWGKNGWLQNFKFSNMVYDFGKYLKVDTQKKMDLKPKL